MKYTANKPSTGAHSTLGFLSVTQAAGYLGISPRSVRRHAATGDLPHRRVGGLLKFERETLQNFARPVGGNWKGGSK